MAKDKPRLARLTAIITQLQSKNLVTATSIAEKHGISVRTVYRDIRTLEKSGIPIVTEEGKGYSIMDGYKLPPIMFTEEEANALITAAQIINKNKDQSLIEYYQRAITKVKSVLKFTQKEKTELLEQRLQVRKKKDDELSSNLLMKLQSAITSYQVVHINYATQENYKSERDIEPFAIFSTNDNWVLVAFCQLKRDFRAFRLDRIQQMRVTSQQFEPHNLTLQQYFEDCRKKWQSTPDIPLTPPVPNFALNQKNNNMQNVKIEAFKVIGISVTTTNENGQAGKDIGALWGKFMGEGIMAQIPNKIDHSVYSIYTNYQGDHTQPYDTILGCKVSSLDEIPEGMVGQSFEGGTYAPFVSKGNLNQGVVYNSWLDIWKAPLDRTYSADFEVYGEKAQNPEDAEVDIFAAVKEYTRN